MAWSDEARKASAEARAAAAKGKADIAAKSNGIAHQEGVAAVPPSMGHNNPPPADGTYDRYGKDNPGTGYMVGGAPEKGTRYTGVWTDDKSGKTYREKSQRANSLTLAKSMGRMRNQISIWDNAHKQTISTGGTGEYKPPKR